MSILRKLGWVAACVTLLSFSAAYGQIETDRGAPQQIPKPAAVAAFGNGNDLAFPACAAQVLPNPLGEILPASGSQECGTQNHYYSSCTSTPQCSSDCSHCNVNGFGSCYVSWCAPYAQSPGECPPGQYKEWVQHCTCSCGGTICGNRCCPDDSYWCGANNRCCNGCAIGCPC
jgi:hypothetical protein